MIMCDKCFSDAELISLIQRKGKHGTCPLCGRKNVYVYNTEEDEELSLMFDELLSIYTPVSLLPQEYPKADIRMLKNELATRWNIFNNKSEAEIYKMTIAICKEKYEYTPEVFDSPIGIAELYDEEYLREHSLLIANSWEEFVKNLKTENRFHTHHLNLDLLRRFCSYIRKPYKQGQIFFRSRISSENGIIEKEMGAPEIEKATDGRANARGIRCLYLGDSAATTIYETRAGAYDYVTVGQFQLKKDIIVADLKGINQISPFMDVLDCLEYAINKEHLNKIDDEMSKVMRRSDSVLEYLPTQYIADFIKSIKDSNGQNEYSGIEYKSVMHKKGYNLALFDPDLFECVATDVYRIDAIDYKESRLQ